MEWNIKYILNPHRHGIVIYERLGIPDLTRKEYIVQQIPVDKYLAIRRKTK